ncbi:MAG: carboxypeptidase-like regulatory domain-containing protein [Candidatus Moranbacteria bacterium]|nr:carboxypeptidase-like regulatory domain-containing protein [Candidatus Moranbacteria bacterium]
MIKKNKKIIKNGFSILEVVAAIGIFMVVFVSVYGSFSAGLRSLSQSKHRIAATQLANEKMEIIRNLPYLDVGTQGGAPSGSLPQEETVWRSNQKFKVRTTIRYIDSPLDGQEPNDSNGVSRDFREARVEVIWGSIQWGKGIILISNIVPDGVENESGGGTLRFNVIDSTGTGVSGADVHITNNATDPNIDIPTQTDSTGSVLLAGMPVGDQTYEFSVSKSGYESVTTLPPYPTNPSYEPVDLHGSVIEGELNSKAIIMDKLGSISLVSKNISDQIVPNVNFNLRGGRILGQTVVDPPAVPETVYKHNIDSETDSGGNYSLDEASPGNYTLLVNEPGLTLVGTETALLPFSLVPEQDANMTLIMADNNINSLVIKIFNNATGEKINGASVRVWDDAGFNQTLVTGAAGQVYFPPNLDPPVTMGAKPYNIAVSAEKFTSYTDTVSINRLTQKEVRLIPEH